MQTDHRNDGVRADATLTSTALARVIAEVRSNSPLPVMGAYNRTYNRHNR